jgi:hypothetical protein
VCGQEFTGQDLFELFVLEFGWMEAEAR